MAGFRLVVFMSQNFPKIKMKPRPLKRKRTSIEKAKVAPGAPGGEPSRQIRGPVCGDGCPRVGLSVRVLGTRESLPVACDPLCSLRAMLSLVSRWQFLKLLAKPAFVTSRADLQHWRLLASPPASLPPVFRCTEPRGHGRRTAQGVRNADSSNKPEICEH